MAKRQKRGATEAADTVQLGAVRKDALAAVEELKTKVLDEALHGAMRIAGLVRFRSTHLYPYLILLPIFFYLFIM